MPEAQQVNAMFGRIAGKYDLANRAMSFGLDVAWREILVDETRARKPRHVVDLATGSGDVAFALRRTLDPATRITALDFCAPMIEEARRKQEQLSEPNIEFGIGDILDLPLPDGCANAATISFGYRNLADRPAGLREMKRILDPRDGHLLILEFSQPHPVFRPLYYLYLKRILPNLAGALTGDKSAYVYLSESVEAFPDRQGVSEELRQAGFSVEEARPLVLGAVALHIAKA